MAKLLRLLDVRYMAAIRHFNQERALDGGMRSAAKFGVLSSDRLLAGWQTILADDGAIVLSDD